MARDSKQKGDEVAVSVRLPRVLYDRLRAKAATKEGNPTAAAIMRWLVVQWVRFDNLKGENQG